MEDIKPKIIFGGTEYELEYDPFNLQKATMEFVINGAKYIAKEVKRETKDKDYEIQSFSTKFSGGIIGYLHLAGNKRYNHGTGVEHFSKSLEDCLSENKYYQIHSVKRLSDGEVFTIGDNIRHIQCYDLCAVIINSFYITDQNEMACLCKGENTSSNYFIENWVKVKPKVPLLTTWSDNKEIFEGDLFWWIKHTCKDFFIHSETITEKKPAGHPFQTCTYFSSIYKAKEFQLLNKPIEVTLKDVLSLWAHDYLLHSSIMKDFFKQKINENER